MHHVFFGLLLPLDLRDLFHRLCRTVLVFQLLLQLDKDLLWLLLPRAPLHLFSLMGFLVLDDLLGGRLLPILLLVLWLLLYHELPVLVEYRQLRGVLYELRVVLIVDVYSWVTHTRINYQSTRQRSQKRLLQTFKLFIF